MAVLVLIGGLVAATVLFVALPDQRWIAGIVAGFAVVEALVLGALLPSRAGPSPAEQIEALNRQAELAVDEGQNAARDDASS
jgi:hypothetical protein